MPTCLLGPRDPRLTPTHSLLSLFRRYPNVAEPRPSEELMRVVSSHDSFVKIIQVPWVEAPQEKDNCACGSYDPV
jgi:hypothetical protein